MAIVILRCCKSFINGLVGFIVPANGNDFASQPHKTRCIRLLKLIVRVVGLCELFRISMFSFKLWIFVNCHHQDFKTFCLHKEYENPSIRNLNCSVSL